ARPRAPGRGGPPLRDCRQAKSPRHNSTAWRGLRETGAWEDGPGHAWRGGKENRGKPQEAARWLPGHGGPVSHVPGFPSRRALAARPDSLVPVSWSPRRLRAPPEPSNAAMRTRAQRATNYDASAGNPAKSHRLAPTRHLSLVIRYPLHHLIMPVPYRKFSRVKVPSGIRGLNSISLITNSVRVSFRSLSSITISSGYQRSSLLATLVTVITFNSRPLRAYNSSLSPTNLSLSIQDFRR